MEIRLQVKCWGMGFVRVFHPPIFDFNSIMFVEFSNIFYSIVLFC